MFASCHGTHSPLRQIYSASTFALTIDPRKRLSQRGYHCVLAKLLPISPIQGPLWNNQSRASVNTTNLVTPATLPPASLAARQRRRDLRLRQNNARADLLDSRHCPQSFLEKPLEMLDVIHVDLNDEIHLAEHERAGRNLRHPRDRLLEFAELLASPGLRQLHLDERGDVHAELLAIEHGDPLLDVSELLELMDALPAR